jgi:hypothetical protein
MKRLSLLCISLALSAGKTTTYNPPQAFRFVKPDVMPTIKMSNNEKSFEPFGTFVFSYHTHPKGAAFRGNLSGNTSE